MHEFAFVSVGTQAVDETYMHGVEVTKLRYQTHLSLPCIHTRMRSFRDSMHCTAWAKRDTVFLSSRACLKPSSYSFSKLDMILKVFSCSFVAVEGQGSFMYESILEMSTRPFLRSSSCCRKALLALDRPIELTNSSTETSHGRQGNFSHCANITCFIMYLAFCIELSLSPCFWMSLHVYTSPSAPC